MANWYVSSVRWTAVTQWAALTAYGLGDIRRQLAAPAAGSERVFRVTTAGISGAAEPTWVLTPAATTADGTVTWTECTGLAIYNGDGGGTAWAAPHARLRNAFASGWAAAGDTVYVGSTHAATEAAAIALIPLGTAASPIRVLCVNNAGSIPPVAADITTGASETTTGASSITLHGTSIAVAYWVGIAFNCGTGASTASLAFGSGTPTTVGIFENCSFSLLNTGANAGFAPATNMRDARFEFYNCSFAFGASSHRISTGAGNILMVGCSFAQTGVVPTTVFIPAVTSNLPVVIRDSDLSAITGNLVSLSLAAQANVSIQNCRLASAVSPSTLNANSQGGLSISMDNCDSAATNYRMFHKNYMGSVQQETSIVRQGGASDGTTPISWNMTTSATSQFYAPYVSPDIAMFNTLTGPRTLTLEIVSNATLTNADIWMEVEYLGNASYPLGTSTLTRAATVLTTGVALPASTVVWNNSPGTAQKLSTTITPLLRGVLKVRVYLAKASQTVYVDPKILLV